MTQRTSRGTDERGKADMHLHTLYSDGTAGVQALLDHVEHRTDLDVVAITDHERIDGALRGATKDHLEILIHGIPLEDGGVAMEQSRVRMGTTTALYRGEITSLHGTSLVAALRSPHQRLRVDLRLRIGRDGSVVGRAHGTAAPVGPATA